MLTVAVMSNVPGFESMDSGLMKKTLSNKGVASIEELRAICIEADVKLVACQMTVDLFNMDRDDFMSEIRDWIGTASFLPEAQKADVSLFI